MQRAVAAPARTAGAPGEDSPRLVPQADEELMRGILSALQRLVVAPGAFVCISGDVPGTTRLGRVVDGQTSIVTARDSLEKRFGVRRSILAAQRQHVLSADTVWPQAARARVGYWRDHSLPDGFATALVILLGDGALLRGIAGVERRGGDATFSTGDAEALVAVEPLFEHAVAAQFRMRGLRRRAAALRALADVKGSVLIVDCVERCLVPASSDAWRPPTRRYQRSE